MIFEVDHAGVFSVMRDEIGKNLMASPCDPFSEFTGALEDSERSFNEFTGKSFGAASRKAPRMTAS
jgi:hypothetical protein